MRYTGWFRRKSRGTPAQDDFAQKLLGEEALRAQRGELFQSKRRVVGADGAQYEAGVVGGQPYVSVVGSTSEHSVDRYTIDMLSGAIYQLSSGTSYTYIPANSAAAYSAPSLAVDASLTVVTNKYTNAFIRYELGAPSAPAVYANDPTFPRSTSAISVANVAGGATGFLGEFLQAKAGAADAAYSVPNGAVQPPSVTYIDESGAFANIYLSVMFFDSQNYSDAACQANAYISGIVLPTNSTSFYLVDLPSYIPNGSSPMARYTKLIVPYWAAQLEFDAASFVTAYRLDPTQFTTADIEYYRRLRHFFFAVADPDLTSRTLVTLTGFPTTPTTMPCGRAYSYAKYKAEASYVAHGTHFSVSIGIDTYGNPTFSSVTVEAVDISWLDSTYTYPFAQISPAMPSSFFSTGAAINVYNYGYGAGVYGSYANGFSANVPTRINALLNAPSPLAYPVRPFYSALATANSGVAEVFERTPYVGGAGITDAGACTSDVLTGYTYGFNTDVKTDINQLYSPYLFYQPNGSGSVAPSSSPVVPTWGYGFTGGANYYTSLLSAPSGYNAPVYGFYDNTDVFCVVRYSMSYTTTKLSPSGNTYKISDAINVMMQYPVFNNTTSVEAAQQYYAKASIPFLLYAHLPVVSASTNAMGTNLIISSQPYSSTITNGSYSYTGNGAHIFVWYGYATARYPDAMFSYTSNIASATVPPMTFVYQLSIPLPWDPVAHTAYSRSAMYQCPYAVYAVSVTAGYTVNSYTNIATSSLWNVPQRPIYAPHTGAAYAFDTDGTFLGSTFVLSAFFSGGTWLFPLQPTDLAVGAWANVAPSRFGDSVSWYIAAQVGAVGTSTFAIDISTAVLTTTTATYNLIAQDMFFNYYTGNQVVKYGTTVPIYSQTYAMSGYQYGPVVTGGTLEYSVGYSASTSPTSFSSDITIQGSAVATYLTECASCDISHAVLYVPFGCCTPVFVKRRLQHSSAQVVQADYPQFVQVDGDPNNLTSSYNGFTTDSLIGPSPPLNSVYTSATTSYVPFDSVSTAECYPHDITSATTGIGVSSYTSSVNTDTVEVFDNINHIVTCQTSFSYDDNNFATVAPKIPPTAFFTPGAPAAGVTGFTGSDAGTPTQYGIIDFSAPSAAVSATTMVRRSAAGFYAYNTAVPNLASAANPFPSITFTGGYPLVGVDILLGSSVYFVGWA